jgi:hypothetical protein
VRREGLTGETASFAREWNAAFGLVALAAGLLFASCHSIAGALALGRCAAAFLARRGAMRRQNRGFYGQERQSR